MSFSINNLIYISNQPTDNIVDNKIIVEYLDIISSNLYLPNTSIGYFAIKN